MNKKLEFQIQSSQGKLINYREILTTLQSSKSNLETVILSSNPNRSKIIELKQLQINLETKLQTLKKSLTTSTNYINNKTQDYVLLDTKYDNKLLEEDNILKDELKRIEEQIIETHINHEKDIKLAYIDKTELLSNIDLLNSELALQNNIITELQMKAHSSRKQILNELHIKKQDKNISNQHITNLKDNEKKFTEQLLYLETTNLKLLDFKKLIVESEYTIDFDKTKLINYYEEYAEYKLGTYINTYLDTLPDTYLDTLPDTYLDTQLSINEKLVILDNVINSNQSRILYIKKKYDKNILSNSIIIKNIIEKYNNTHNNIHNKKVIGFKDQFRIEREKGNQLETIIADIYNKYNTFEINIIAIINNKLVIAIQDLENDKIRAIERLTIMKQRIIEEFKNEQINTNSIIDNTKSNLFNMRIEFDNIKSDLENTKQMLESENKFESELDKINIEINKYQTIIQQIENDIVKLTSRTI